MEPNLVNATPDAALDEVVNLVENVDVNDFSLDLTLDDDATKALIHRSVVENNALKIFEMGPWSPCGGFLLLTMMPFHGKWASADLNHVRIWVRVLGVPYRFYSNENIKKLANRVGTFITANKIRINGVTRNNFLRFQVNLNFSNPLLVGAGLDDENGNIPLYGLWLKHVLRLENGFAVLAAEDYKDRIHMENESVSDAIPYENSVSGTQAPMATVKLVGCIFQGGDYSFSIVDERRAHPSKVIPSLDQEDQCPHPFRQISISSVEKAHSTKAQLEVDNSGGRGSFNLGGSKSKANKKIFYGARKMTRPRGIPIRPIFGSLTDLEFTTSRFKRKKLNQVFAKMSTNSMIELKHDSQIPKEKAPFLERLNTVEEVVCPQHFPTVERGETGPNEGTPMVDECEFQELARNYNKKRKLDKPESLLALEQDDGGKPYHAPQYLMKALSWNCWGLGQSCDVKALRGLVWFGVFVYATPSRGDCKEFWENMALEDRCLKPFRFLDAWTRDPDCMEVVRINPTIFEACNKELVRIPDYEGIRKLVWSLDAVAIVKEFFKSGEFHRDLNITFIVLIPKNMKASKCDDFRPISLCNFAYKIIAKILANRLHPTLFGIISPFQSAFVPNRWITENGILSHELIDSFKKIRGGNGFVGLKLDMSKAYDHLEWNFVDKVLEAFGYGIKFCALISKCIMKFSLDLFPARNLLVASTSSGVMLAALLLPTSYVAEPFDLTPPKRASMRNYSDVSIRGSKAFVATLVVDLEGVVVATHMNKFDISSPLEAEAFWFTNGSGVLQEIGLE
uniref:Reverse transcriptase domain-containing protein n=1 Tax=Cannabis sativa TaxID=3483 RepID=A0A803QSC0_CANSA